MQKWIAWALALETLTMAGLLMVALDLQAHKRVERLGGVNLWGYRGPVMPHRRPNEIRIAVIGGDLAFGWGVAASETLAPTIRQLVALETDRPGRPLRPVTAVNLGAVGLTPDRYAAWIARFAYLKPDVVCIVADPRDHRALDAPVLPDRATTAFALTGYASILPLVVEQKGTMRHWPLLQSIGAHAAAADHAVARIVADVPNEGGAAGSPAAYARAIEEAAQSALRNGAGVVIVAPPYGGAGEVGDHAALAEMIASRFAAERRVRFVDLGDAPDIHDPGLWLKELALSTAGHAKAAEHVAPAVLEVLATSDQSPATSHQPPAAAR